jgi:Serine kinase of the HPr protein, regulates carbohydrate metabolism
MDQEYTIRLKEVVIDHELEIVHAAPDYETALISSSDINRPGLQLSGFYDYFDPSRLQIMGIVETTYLLAKTSEERRSSFEELFKRKISALVICHGVSPLPECIAMAEKHGINLLSTEVDTSEFMAQVIGTLKLALAPRITLHGVLMEVHGEGVLLLGDSGIGKSETALELIKRGHRLIADDAVEIKRASRTTLVGSAPELIRYYMEVRGIGVIDVRRIFGIGAIKPVERIDYIVNLEVWDKETTYNRLGIETEYTSILGVKVPCTTIPIRPGRNLAVILELAAINHRQKKMGFNAALELVESHDRAIDKLSSERDSLSDTGFMDY